MLYYRVKPEFDNKPLYEFVGNSNLKIKHAGILVGNELYTPRERERLAVKDLVFEKVEISRKKIYFFFGARFSDDTGVTLPF